MQILHSKCAGLDVHKDTVVACVRRLSRNQIQQEVRTFSTVSKSLYELAEWLASFGVTIVAMEATGVYWKPVWHVLDASGFKLVLANAAHIKAVPGRKTDVNDAMWIADLLAHGLIRGSFVPEQPIQELRDLTRARKQFVRQHTQHVQRSPERFVSKGAISIAVVPSAAPGMLRISGDRPRVANSILLMSTQPSTSGPPEDRAVFQSACSAIADMPLGRAH